MKVPMDQCRVPSGLRRGLFADLVDQLGLMQDKLAQDQSLGPVEALKTAGTLPPDGWANELHPTPAGFRLLGETKFLLALDEIWGVATKSGTAPKKAATPIVAKKAAPSKKKAAKTAAPKKVAKKGSAKTRPT